MQTVYLLVLGLLLGLAEGFLVAPAARPAAAGAAAQAVSAKAASSSVQPLGTGVTALRASTEAAESSRQAAVRERLSQEWELDCYSRPVVGEDGKKLWELLICDSLGEFRAVETMPSNMVNSRELRKLVERVRVHSRMRVRVCPEANQ